MSRPIIQLRFISFILLISIFIIQCNPKQADHIDGFVTISKEVLKDKIKGAWAAQTIGVTYGGPTEFKYNKNIIPDSIEIHWSDTMMYHWMKHIPGLYDDVYMDLTFVEVMEKEGIDAPAASHAKAYANAKYWLWHANQQGRYNILHGITPPESGHWFNNPHADDIDFQIEADFAG
ncbi:MAG: ADP-ribosylglycohydrolase family protein, partial [Cyclobacteriaceae bacterium]|nr:ADP-ribosylglycohydrolase family protein [Cyclobacteriaceae bacterium]